MNTPSHDRARLRRKPERARPDPKFRDAVLDEGLVGHVSWVERGAPCVLPMAYVRVGAELHLHGSREQRALVHVLAGGEVCVCVTLLDALVLARSMKNHSLNYRCVVAWGKGRELTDPAAKRRSLEALVEHVIPGRSTGARAPTEAELQATLVVAIPLDEWSCKQREGGPRDYPQDLALPYWAGELPLGVAVGEPLQELGSAGARPLPDHVRAWKRGGLRRGAAGTHDR
jgi:nitroimidazol reductase NimA-like FMN-containing flavoprotein (pyridoxamine 5'-phosphate oxidase superfamily)